MFITTSRKPSAKTRTFCQSLSRALNADYTNRGKMSFRDVLIKASGFKIIAVVSQVKGNPSRIEFYNKKGELLLTLYITEAILDLEGRINTNKLTLRCEVDELTPKLLDILKIDECTDNSTKNIIWIRKDEGEGEAIIEFYGKEGMIVNPKIYVRRFE
ncbi:ribosomal biogenesis protein [Methanobacterium sp. ACI-7]|uniref:ribosomal biogenesis protein n=1 Tax=unclassified Methanobacterium TaxID=2627676 RepID=UPI0039C2ADB3